MPAGLVAPNRPNLTGAPYSPLPIAPSPNMAYGSPGNFQAAATTQAGDYDKIMSSYDNLVKMSSGANQPRPISYSPIAPQTTPYQPTSEASSAMGNLSGLASSGGYSGADIANLRARAVSPIRSIYANAQRNLDRNRTLSGGYSPNYAAASAKMARDMSEQLGQANTNVEAGLAENVARNRLSIAPTFASFAGEQERARMANEQANAEAINRANEFNTQNLLGVETGNRAFETQNKNNILAAIEGMKSLYGTTPALTSTFGNQVAQAGQLGQNQQEINNRRQQDMFGRAMPIFG